MQKVKRYSLKHAKTSNKLFFIKNSRAFYHLLNYINPKIDNRQDILIELVIVIHMLVVSL